MTSSMPLMMMTPSPNVKAVMATSTATSAAVSPFTL